MTELTPELARIGQDLHAAVGRRIARTRRRARRARQAAAVIAAFAAFAGVAVASGIDDDLRLDPTKWVIFETGSVDGGRGVYVKAWKKDGTGDGTFAVEHAEGLDPYERFLLHLHTSDAAGVSPQITVQVCSREQLTRAEQIALDAFRSHEPSAGTAPRNADAAVNAAFAGQICRGLDYAIARVGSFYFSFEPASILMPEVR